MVQVRYCKIYLLFCCRSRECLNETWVKAKVDSVAARVVEMLRTRSKVRLKSMMTKSPDSTFNGKTDLNKHGENRGNIVRKRDREIA
jgi:hypothetical protein